MGVTIDNLQIEIQSNSTNATQGIDNFAKSLETLKKSSKLTTVTKQLNALSSAIKGFSDASRSASALGTLATAIEKLRSAGSIASQATNLTKLQTALRALETVNIGSVGPKIKELADALAPLSQVKAGGFGTLIRSLSQLGEVTKKLDDKTINEFAKKIELLDDKLGPFAEKMANVKTAFNAINTQARKAASGVDKFDDGIDAARLNLASLVEISQAFIQTLQGIITQFAEIVHEASEWDGVSARFGRGFGDQAQEVYDWIKRLNEEMGLNIQQFMKYSSIYSNMLQGFGVNDADANKMALGYTELTYDIWAGYNDIYKTFDDASEAVKSAIAGEVEPVRRAGFTIVESTLEQTAANHGLEISLYNATEAQKSYLRYLTLVDQAHAQNLVGTYAKELNTAEGLMRTFSQQLKSLAQAFGSLFLPILVKVMPWLQAFVELLTEAVYWFANLVGVDIQPVDFSGFDAGAGTLDNVANSAGGAADSLDDATKAAKELKNATLGIDELNVISPSSATSGAGGGSGGVGGAGSDGFAGLDIESLWDETIFDTIQSDVDAIKDKLRGWMPVIATVAAALAGLRLIKLLDDIKAIQAITISGGLIKKLAGFSTAFASLAKEGGFIAALAAAFPKLSKAISTFVGNFGAFIALAKEGGVMKALAAAFPKIANALSKVSSKFGWIGAIIAAVISAIVFLIENWEKMKAVVVNFFDENIAPKFEEIKKHIDNIIEAFKPLAPVFEWVGKAFRWVSDAFDWLLEAIGGVVVALTGGALAGAFNAIVKTIEGVVQWLSGVVQIVRGIVDLLIGIFTLDGQKIVEACKKIGSGIKDVFVGLYDSTIGTVVEFVKGVIDWFVQMWDELVGHSIVPDTVNAIVKWFTSLPSKIFGSIEKFVTGILDKFKGLWSKLSSWWNGKTKLKEYTPSIGSIYDKLKSRWDSARAWWNEKKSKLKEYTPSIGSIYDKLKVRWDNARNWWNGKKAALKSYTPSIGSILDKLKSAWTTAKNWWNRNVKLSIPSLKFKITYSTPSSKTMKAVMKALDLPGWPKLSFAANGGMFNQGSLIWAGERGPEIMANAGSGRTGVMNVQQMSEAMYEAVYSATIAANRMAGGGNGDGSIKLYIDGREITTVVEKRQNERGASIMSNPVYSF